MEIKTIYINTPLRRIALLGGGLLLLVILFYCAKWTFANMASQSAETAEIAELIASLAPDDPQTHYAAAVVLEKTFNPDDLTRATAEYEIAAALTPHNYLLWLALGRARERAGDSAGAETAVRRALELAPHYAVVHWTLGNILLRQGKLDEAFAEIRTAVASDSNFAAPAVAISWQILDGSVTEVKRAIGDSQATNAAFTMLLAREKRFDQAFEAWSLLPPEARSGEQKASGEELLRSFVNEKKYHLAVRMHNSMSGEDGQTLMIGEIGNPGFETDIELQNAGLFEWQITAGGHPQIVLSDGQRRTGARSLWLIFKSADGREFRQVSQTVAVEPGRRYELELFYKADLKTAATMKWEIVDASHSTLLGATNLLEAVRTDWSSLKADFVMPSGSEGIVLRLVREDCRSAICPIAGSVWFDDFSLRTR